MSQSLSDNSDSGGENRYFDYVAPDPTTFIYKLAVSLQKNHKFGRELAPSFASCASL